MNALQARGAFARRNMKENARRLERQQSEAQARQDEQQRQEQKARSDATARELTAQFAEHQKITLGEITMSNDYETEEYARILQQHQDQIRQEVEAVQATREETRLEKQLATELQALAAELAPLQKFPSRYRLRIAELVAKVEEKSAQLDRLSLKPAEKNWQLAGNRVFTVFPGGKIER